MLDFLLQKARSLQQFDSFIAHHLTEQAPPDATWVTLWGGAMVLPLPGMADSWLLFARQIVTRKIHWAGAPGKAVVQSAQGLLVLGPRTSFQRWTE